MRPSRRRRLRLSVIGLVVAAGVATGIGFATSGNAKAGYDGDPLAVPRPTTTLTDTSGAPWSLAKQGLGKATLVYFGYTHCPDLCPTTMGDVRVAVSKLSSAERSKVQVVFVTVDPAHDSLPVMRRWLDDFSPSFIGLTGAYSDILAMGNTLNAGVSTTPPVTVNGKTIVQHGSVLVGLTPYGRAPVFYIPSVDGSYQGPSLQQQLDHDIPLLEKGVGA